MEFKLLHVYTLLSMVALVGSNALLSPDVYWKSVLPSTPMPKAITHLLSNAQAWEDGKEKVPMDTYIKLTQSYNPYSKYEVKDDEPLQSYWAWRQGSKEQQKHNPIMKLLFLETNLHQGEEVKLHFMKNTHKTELLPKNISDSIPFSLNDLPKIYNKFKVKPDSKEAEIIKHVLNICQYNISEGEEIFCATSLESMIDLTTMKLGKKVRALSTEVYSKKGTPSQKYKIGLVKKLAERNKVVVCHMQSYAYAVFFCHVSVDIRSYAVSLEGADGTKVNSVAICHTDTSKINPKHLAFEVLKVAPGTVPLCHFQPEDHVLWVPY